MELTNLSPEELLAMLAAVEYIYNHDLEEKAIEELLDHESTEEGENFPEKFDEWNFEQAWGTLLNKAQDESILMESLDYDDFDDTYDCGCCRCCGCTCGDDEIWENWGSFDDDEYEDLHEGE